MEKCRNSRSRLFWANSISKKYFANIGPELISFIWKEPNPWNVE